MTTDTTRVNNIKITVVTVNNSIYFQNASLLDYHNLKEASRTEQDIELNVNDGTSVNLKGKYLVSITKEEK